MAEPASVPPRNPFAAFAEVDAGVKVVGMLLTILSNMLWDLADLVEDGDEQAVALEKILEARSQAAGVALAFGQVVDTFGLGVRVLRAAGVHQQFKDDPGSANPAAAAAYDSEHRRGRRPHNDE